MTHEPAWKRLRRQANTERLRELIGGELRESSAEDYPHGRPVGEQVTESFADVTTPDTRPDSTVCAFCQRGARRLRVTQNGYLLCASCAAQPQADPKAADYWTSLARPVRRARLIARFGVDPVTWEPSRFRLRCSTFHDDADGIPSSMFTQDTTRVIFIGMPRCWWNVLEERGPRIATPPRRG